MKRSMGFTMIPMVTIALLMVEPSEAIGCSEFANMLSPCVKYLQSGGSPGSGCCAGAKRVQGALHSQEDRRIACKCAKGAAGRFKVRRDTANSLPSKCGISTSIPINPHVNCDTS